MKRIVLVEDQLMLRELLTEVLQSRFSVEPCHCIHAALEAVERETPDLVVTDVGLPDGNGLDLVAKLRSAWSPDELPILVLSGRAAEEDLMGGFAAGASDYLTKPVRNAELLAKCGLMIARSRRGLQTPASSNRLAGADLPGGSEAAFGRYRIRGVLGQGAHGVVYRAEDIENDDQIVALKVLAGEKGDATEARQRFLRETYTLSLVRHSNVARVIDFGNGEGRLYCAMECVSGRTVAEQVREQGAASDDQVLDLLEGAALALQALARVDIVHRDLKPSNIILRDNHHHRPAIVDFGLAKRPLDRTLTRTGALLGTPAYMAPETILSGVCDLRGDLFSLGLVALYARTGREAFQDREGLSLLRALTSEAVPVPADLSPGLREILVRLTSIDPDQRFAHPGALLNAIAGCRAKAVAA